MRFECLDRCNVQCLQWVETGPSAGMSALGGKRTLVLPGPTQPPSTPKAGTGKESKHRCPSSLEPNIFWLASIFANAFRQKQEEAERTQQGEGAERAN
jgi:hypothetical protein